MRKICLLAFSFLIFSLSINLLSAKALAITEEAASSSPQQVNYELPYPGLLPDSPLYFLRIIRDRIVGFLISDSLKKSEFNLLQADKRLNAGIFLFNKGKIPLAFSTISKAENYFSQALDKIEEAKKQGENISEVEGKLKNALRKHEQELEILTKKVNSDYKESFEKELEKVKSFGERLNQ
jgi:tetratricopeptide (TPR) repeat protein